MATIVKEWSDGSVSIAVEADKDSINKEGTHVHVYKRGRRTRTRIPGNNMDLDDSDMRTAEKLFDRYYRDICEACEKVKRG